MPKKNAESIQSTQSTSTIQPIHFEKTLTELDGVVKKMEQGDLSLEDSLQNFEHGIKLARLCQSALKEAEQKVRVLIEEQGILKTEPFLVEE